MEQPDEEQLQRGPGESGEQDKKAGRAPPPLLLLPQFFLFFGVERVVSDTCYFCLEGFGLELAFHVA